MEAIYAALLLHKAEKSITEASLEKVLKAAGAKVDKTQLKTLVAGLEGKDIDELVAKSAAVPVAAGGGEPAKKGKKSKKKSKKKDEDEKEKEVAGIGALFG
ncbi:MAG: 50S ribosomal protein P1 [Candidatus Lokiarchaeota archaeon]|nr:50S ribosomal protein P1 [Candidatus Lokiarchaeota archaeon]